MWTLTEAQKLVQSINERVRPFNYHAGIIGSVITKGESSNDLDIVLLPRVDDNTINCSGVQTMLILEGAILAQELTEEEYSESSNRYIYKLNIGSKIVDFFVYDI